MRHRTYVNNRFVQMYFGIVGVPFMILHVYIIKFCMRTLLHMWNITARQHGIVDWSPKPEATMDE